MTPKEMKKEIKRLRKATVKLNKKKTDIERVEEAINLQETLATAAEEHLDAKVNYAERQLG